MALIRPFGETKVIAHDRAKGRLRIDFECETSEAKKSQPLKQTAPAKLTALTFWWEVKGSEMPTGSYEPNRALGTTKNAAVVDFVGLVLRSARTSNQNKLITVDGTLFEATRKGKVGAWVHQLFGTGEDDEVFGTWIGGGKIASQRVVELRKSWNIIEIDVHCNGVEQPASLFGQIEDWLLDLGKNPREPNWILNPPPPPIILAEKPEVWVDRIGFGKAINEFRKAHDSGILEITGEMGRGKTTAMLGLLYGLSDDERGGKRDSRPIFHFFGLGNEYAESVDPRTAARSLFEQLIAKYNFTLEERWEDEFPLSDPNRHIKRLQALIARNLGPHLATSNAGKTQDEIVSETFFIEAADQSEDDVHLVPKVLGTLPKYVYAVITTRPNTHRWNAAPDLITLTLPFEGMVNDFEDGKAYVKKCDYRYTLNLDPTLIAEIFMSSPERPPPVMFTLESRIQSLRKLPSEPEAELIRKDPELWWIEPEKLVRKEIKAVIDRVRLPPESLTEEEVLSTLGFSAIAGIALRPSLVHALGLASEFSGSVMRLAANSFLRRPEPDSPWAFRHPGYRRRILELADENLLHRRLVSACQHHWKLSRIDDDPSPARVYAVQFLPTHLRSAGEKAELLDVLCNPNFLVAAIHVGKIAETAAFYQEALDYMDPLEGARRVRREEGTAAYIKRLNSYTGFFARCAKEDGTGGTDYFQSTKPVPELPIFDSIHWPTKAELLERERRREDVDNLLERLYKVKELVAGCVNETHQTTDNTNLVGRFASQWSLAMPPSIERPQTFGISWICRHWPFFRASLPTAREHISLRLHSSDVDAVAISFDGQLSVSLAGGTGLLWKRSGSLITLANEFRTGDRLYETAAISPDGRIVATSSFFGLIEIYDCSVPKNPRLVKRWDQREYTRMMAITPDASRLAISDGKSVMFIDTVHRDPPYVTAFNRLDDDYAKAIGLTPDGREVIIITVAGKIIIWNPVLNRVNEIDLLQDALRGFTAVSINADGQAFFVLDKHRNLRICEFRGKGAFRELGQVLVPVHKFSISGNSEWVIWSGNDEIVHISLLSAFVAGVADGHRIGIDTANRLLAVSPSGERAISNEQDHAVVWRRAVTGEWNEVYRVLGLNWPLCGVFTKDSNKVAWGGGSGTIVLRDLTSPSESNRIITISARRVIDKIAMTPAAETIVVSAGGPFLVVDFSEGAGVVPAATLVSVNEKTFCVSVSENGKYVAAVDSDYLRVWENNGNGSWREKATLGSDKFSCVEVFADGRWAVTGGRFGDVRIWDLSTDGSARETARFLGGHSNVIGLGLSRDGDIIVYVEKSGVLRYLERSSYGLVCISALTLNQSVKCMALDPVELTVTIGTESNEIFTFDLVRGTD